MWCHIIALPLFFCPNRKIKMRLIEIKISVYEKDVADIVGNDNHKLDELRSCCIDLDKVESFWEDPVKDGGDGLLIKMDSKDSYWTESFTLDQFREKLYDGLLQHSGNVGTGICAGVPEVCVVCGNEEIRHNGHEHECSKCGFKWVTSNAPKRSFNG